MSEHKSLLPAQPEIVKLLSDPLKNLKALFEHRMNRLKESTRKAYAQAWANFARYLGVENGFEALRALLSCKSGMEANGVVEAYIDQMANKYSPKTISLRLTAVRSITEWFFGILGTAWKITVIGPAVVVYKDTAGVGKEAILEALKALDKMTDPISIRDMAIIRLLYANGLRRNEVVTLDLHHVDFKKKQVHLLRKGKAMNERLPVTIGPHTEDGLKRWIAVRRPGPGPLFTNFDQAKKGERLTGNSIRRTCHKYHLGRPHGIRHTAGTEVAKRLKDPYQVKEFLGQADIRTAIIYMDHLKDLAGEATKMLDGDI